MTTPGHNGSDLVPFEDWDRPRQAWLLSGEYGGQRRTLLLEMTTRVLFRTLLVFSLYLLLVGHYGPGGGFSAGLVAGLAFVLRYAAGGSSDLGAVVRVPPLAVSGTGLTMALVTALVPATFGAPVLSTTKLAADLALLGRLEVQTSVFLDVGVYLLVIGVVLGLLRSLGTGIDRDTADAESDS